MEQNASVVETGVGKSVDAVTLAEALSSASASCTAWQLEDISGFRTYRGSCTVLLQAILTQTCRVLLAFCTIGAKGSAFSSRIKTVTAVYVPEEKAACIIEDANEYIIFTAIHVVHCDSQPHYVCRHRHGELAAAVSIVLEDESARAELSKTLIEHVSRRSNNKSSFTCLRDCATSTTPVEFRKFPVTCGVGDISPQLLLQVFPELEVTSLMNGGGSVGVLYDVHCGCSHRWFREILPLFLLRTTMDEHARLWHRTSVLLQAFTRLRRRRGMRLLRSIMNGDAWAEQGTNFQKSPRTITQVASDKFEVSAVTAEREEGEAEAGDANVIFSGEVRQNPCSGNTADHINSNVSNNDGGSGAASGPIGGVSERSPSSVARFPSDTSLEESQYLEDFARQADSFASMSLKRRCFSKWHYVRMSERRYVRNKQRILEKRITKDCFDRWQRRWLHSKELRSNECMEKMCQDFILAKHRISRKHSFKVLRELYLLRRFVKGNLARKCLHKWRCAYTLAVFLRRKTLPPTSDYTLLEDCFSWWRRSYRDRIADRAYARQCVVLVLQQMRRRIVWKAQEKAAARHEELNLKRQSFAAWSNAWQLRKLCSRFELRAGRRLLQRIMTVWRIRWLRRESATERLRTFYAVQSRGRVIRSFYHWRQRLYLKRGRRRVSKTLERSLAMAVWVRWKGRLASRQQLAGKDESRASNTRCTMLARAVWRIWRQRYAQRQELRHAAHQEELIERIKTAQKQKMMAMVYFTWKRKVHMLRRRITSKRSGNVATGNALAGLNQSFQNSDTSQSASNPVNAITNVETGQWDMCQQQRHNVFSTVHGASSTRLKRWYDPNEPLGELRTERLLLHCVDSPRWKRMIHSRLFTSNKRKKPSRNAKEVEVDDPYLSAYPLPRHLKGGGGPAWLSLGDGSVDVTESLPSEIEIDPYLSLDGSELGIQEP